MNKKDIFDENVLKDYGDFKDLNFLWREEMNMIKRLLHNFNIFRDKKNEDKYHLIFKLVAQAQFIFRQIEEKEHQFNNVNMILKDTRSKFKGNKANFLINLYNQRNILKKKFGELGN
mmetsp:Transcript_21845/g.16200  ORF Transcript_21845/g.16200 Transcript_21845/m.16200 type:complete len:117 (+) Transcript_21845:2147-2497(+)